MNLSKKRTLYPSMLCVCAVIFLGCSEDGVISASETNSVPAGDVFVPADLDSGSTTPQPEDVAVPKVEPDVAPDVEQSSDVFDDDYPPTGHTWFVNLSDGVWERPDNIEKLTADMGEAATFFVGIHARTATTADLMLAVGGGEEQDFCSRTIVMDGVALLEDRVFRFGPRDFTIANGTLTQNLMIEGRFSPDFSKLEDMVMEGVLVMSTVPDDILPLPNNTEPCELLSVLTVNCTECDDGTVACLDTRLSQFGGVLVPGLSLVENLEADCHPQCEASAENPDCDTSTW